MIIEAKNILDPMDIEQITALEQRVHQTDQTKRDIYLDSRFNYTDSIPAFWLAKEGETLVGFLSIYVDNPEEAEISVIVHPGFRQQGIAKSLIKQAKSVLQEHNISDIAYVSERQFIERSPYLANKYHIDYIGTEYIMQADGLKEQDFVNHAVRVRQATLADAREIATFQAKAFDISLQEALTYAEGSMDDGENMLYVFVDEADKILGSSSVNVTDDYYYLFGLAVDPAYQGQGIASIGIYQVMEQLNSLRERPFRLSVEKENEHAIYLYQKNGFKIITEVLYLYE